MKMKTEDILFPFKHCCSFNLRCLADRHYIHLKLHPLEVEALPNLTSPLQSHLFDSVLISYTQSPSLHLAIALSLFVS